MRPTLSLFDRDPNVIDACPECGAVLRFERTDEGDWIRCAECAWRVRVPEEPRTE